MELLILVSDFMVNSMLKNTQGIPVECMKCLNKNAKKKKKKNRYCTSRVEMIKLLPVLNCSILCMSLVDVMLI